MKNGVDIVVGGKSFGYQFDTEDEINTLLWGLRHGMKVWIDIKEDLFRVAEIQAVIRWR